MEIHPLPSSVRGKPFLHLALVSLALVLLAGPAWHRLAAADSRPAFMPAEPLQSTDGLGIELRFPLGTWLRPGCRLPLYVKIKSSRDCRVRVGVVPELWLTDAQSGSLEARQAPRVDFARVGGGSWSESLPLAAVSGLGAAGQVVDMLPVLDDARQHLVIVGLDAAGGGASAHTGQVIWRGDLSRFLHELSPEDRLVVRASVHPGTGSGAATPPSDGESSSPIEIPNAVTLPDQSNATPILVDAWTVEFPAETAAWNAIDLLLLEDRNFAPDRARAGHEEVPFTPAQRAALEAWLTRGGQAIVIMPQDAAHLWALEHWLGRPPPAAWQFRGDGGSGGSPQPAGSLAPASPAAQLAEAGLPETLASQFPFVPLPAGFGCLTLAWPSPTTASGDGATPARVAWQQRFTGRLAQSEPRLQPRQRIDAEAYTLVFDPQTTRIPNRLIGQIWWFLAAVTGALLLVGMVALRRSPESNLPSVSDLSSVSGAPLTALSTPGTAQRTSHSEWTAWCTGAIAILAVGGVASLYGARTRLSAVEWRMAYVAADGRACETRYTYLNTLRTTGDVRLVPDQKGFEALTEGLPLVAAQRDFSVESGRLSATGAPQLDGVVLESFRPLLLRSTGTSARWTNFPVGTLRHAGASRPPALVLDERMAALHAQADWAIYLEACLPSLGVPRLPDEFAGGVVERDTLSGGWTVQPLWVRGAQVHLPTWLSAQEDIYKPGSLRWVFGQIRQVTRAPVLVLFQRRTLAESTWCAGTSTTPAPLDDSLQITVLELLEKDP